MAEYSGLPVSWLSAGLRSRCPRCGNGALYEGLLTVRGHCEVCGFDLRNQDPGDGPAVFVILILGFLVVGCAVLLEIKLEPPLWVHAILWPPIVLGGAILMLRTFKAVLLALQYRHRATSSDAL